MYIYNKNCNVHMYVYINIVYSIQAYISMLMLRQVFIWFIWLVLLGLIDHVWRTLSLDLMFTDLSQQYRAQKRPFHVAPGPTNNPKRTRNPSSREYLEVSWNRGTPKSSICEWIFHYKPSILASPSMETPIYPSIYRHIHPVSTFHQWGSSIPIKWLNISPLSNSLRSKKRYPTRHQAFQNSQFC